MTFTVCCVHGGMPASPNVQSGKSENILACSQCQRKEDANTSWRYCWYCCAVKIKKKRRKIEKKTHTKRFSHSLCAFLSPYSLFSFSRLGCLWSCRVATYTRAHTNLEYSRIYKHIICIFTCIYDVFFRLARVLPVECPMLLNVACLITLCEQRAASCVVHTVRWCRRTRTRSQQQRIKIIINK